MTISYGIEAGECFPIEQIPGTTILRDYIEIVAECTSWERRQDLLPERWSSTHGSVSVILHDDRTRLTKMRLLNVLWDLHLLMERFGAVANLDVVIIINEDDVRFAFLDLRIDAPDDT